MRKKKVPVQRVGLAEMKDYTTKRYPDARDIRKAVRERIVDLV